MSKTNKNSVEVFINEEYGYRTWKWTPNMTEQELIGWFSDLTDTDIIKFYFNLKALPGEIKPWTESKNATVGKEERRFYGDPTSFKPYYYMHFHDVEDTVLCIGSDVYRYKPTMKYDWKTHWIDHRLRMEDRQNSSS